MRGVSELALSVGVTYDINENRNRKLQRQLDAMGTPFQFAQRFSPYPPVAPPQYDEIAKLKEELHASQMREKDTKIQFLQYQMQQQAMLTQQCLDSLKFWQSGQGQSASEMQTITFTQTQTKTTNVMKN